MTAFLLLRTEARVAAAPAALLLSRQEQSHVPDPCWVTSQVHLWDVGTELNEEPAVGAHTGPHQASSIDGPGPADSDTHVRKISSPTPLSDGSMFNVPTVASMIQVAVSSTAATREFTVRIQNVSSDTATLQTSQGFKPVRVSPGVFLVSAGGHSLGLFNTPWGATSPARPGNAYTFEVSARPGAGSA